MGWCARVKRVLDGAFAAAVGQRQKRTLPIFDRRTRVQIDCSGSKHHEPEEKVQDRQLYEQILGIGAPWQVERVELKQDEGAVHVYLEHQDDQLWPCPECERECRLYDHQAERRWRHLDTCQFQTILHAAPPRSECSEHGVRVVRLPWAEPNSRFTALFERLAIDWLKVASQKAVAENLNLSWDEIHRIMERAVERGLKRRKAETVRHIGIDEKAFRRGHRYLTLVNDLDRGCVLYVADERRQSSLDGFWPTLFSVNHFFRSATFKIPVLFL
jgi:transposase